MTYDGAGNILNDTRAGSIYAYTYNKANRLKTTSFEGNLKGTYTYSGLEQLIIRVVSNSGTLNGTRHYIHDRFGNVIAETNGTAGVAGTLREYIWLPGAEIAPTMESRTVVDMPVAVVEGVNTPTPQTWMVHVDHLHRPVRMTNSTKAAVWQATWSPWGAPHQITGSAVLDARFPGQWFQLEAGLHYNWHRHYDASLGRYTQPDPLGFVDGPSVYGYAGGSPGRWVDRDGREIPQESNECPDSKAIFGSRVHATILEYVQVINGNRPTIDGNRAITNIFGRPDIIDFSSRRVYEIKPVNWGSGYQYSKARRQVNDYADNNALFPGSMYDLIDASQTTFIFEDQIVELVPDRPVSSGLIFYRCKRRNVCPGGNTRLGPLIK